MRVEDHQHIVDASSTLLPLVQRPWSGGSRLKALPPSRVRVSK